MALWCTLLLKLSNYAHYCKSSYNPLLTYAKSAIHIRTTSTWFYSCYNELVSAAPGSTCPSRSARPRNCLNITLPSNNTKINSWRRSDIAVGQKFRRGDVALRNIYYNYKWVTGQMRILHPPLRGGRPTTSISSPNHILIIFSSEPHRYPRPFNIIFFKCPILENKYIF